MYSTTKEKMGRAQGSKFSLGSEQKFQWKLGIIGGCTIFTPNSDNFLSGPHFLHHFYPGPNFLPTALDGEKKILPKIGNNCYGQIKLKKLMLPTSPTFVKNEAELPPLPDYWDGGNEEGRKVGVGRIQLWLPKLTRAAIPNNDLYSSMTENKYSPIASTTHFFLPLFFFFFFQENLSTTLVK